VARLLAPPRPAARRSASRRQTTAKPILQKTDSVLRKFNNFAAALSRNSTKMKALYTVGLLVVANIFMTIAWYGHLKFGTAAGAGGRSHFPLIALILISWGVAFFEYCLQVPANRLGFTGAGGPFSLIELKIIQEVISLSVFTVFALVVFRTETFRLNHLISFALLVAAVFFAFKK
jgi:uncharacterized protein (DUF486 family)